MKKTLRRFFAFGILLLVVAEFGLRMFGVLDFPLYSKDRELGYIQNVNQKGVYLNKNAWEINEFHLFGGKYEKPKNTSVFLIGDSIVWCGNPYLYDDRFCVKLERTSGLKVWSAAAGSWSSWSEIGYMKRFPAVVENADFLIWVFNSGDFTEPTVWSSESTHPTHRPLFATIYMWEKFIAPRLILKSPVSEPSKPIDFKEMHKTIDFIKSISFHKQKTIILLWPDKNELASLQARSLYYMQIKKELCLVSSANIEFVDLAESGVLRDDCYRDGIHPNGKGVDLITKFLNAELRSPTRRYSE